MGAGIRRELRIDMSGPDPKDRLQVLAALERAGEQMNQSQFRKAAIDLQKTLSQDPTNPLVYQHLGTCYTRLGQYRRALQVYEQAIEQAAETDETYAEMGEIYIRLGDLRRAAESLEKSTARNPAGLQAMTNLATVYLQVTELDEAERVINAILSQDERHAMAYNLYGILQIQKGQDALARVNFEKAVRYDPGLIEPYMNLGILAQEAGQTDLALSYFKKFVENASPQEHGEILPRVRAVIAELEAAQ